MRKFKFPDSESILDDPFFVKSALLSMINYTNLDALQDEDPKLYSFLIQIADEESVEMEGDWVITEGTSMYQQDVLEDFAQDIKRMN